MIYRSSHLDLIELTEHSLDGAAPWAVAVIRSLARVAGQGASDELLLRTLHAHVVAGPFEE